MRKLVLTVLTLCCCTVSAWSETFRFDIKAAVQEGDIHRNGYVDGPVLPMNQGNGCFGSSYSQLGLHVHPSLTERDNKYGNTHLIHLKYWIRAKFGADYLLPLARIYWENPRMEVANLSQHQSFYNGTLQTRFSTGQTEVDLTTWFDSYEKNVAGYRFFIYGKASPVVVIEAEKLLNIHYSQCVPREVTIRNEGKIWEVSLTCQNKTAVFYVKTNADVEVSDNKLRITLHEGVNDVLLSYENPTKITADKSLKQTTNWWHRKWNEVTGIRFSDMTAQRMWIRSMALFLSTFGPEKIGLAPPCGFAGNNWPFPYPQDLSFIHPVLLQTGNLDIAKSWVEYFAEHIEGMKAYTERLLKVKGILAPWVFPYGDFEGYHDPTPPNKFYYEIHNSGYLARMAYETAVFVNDKAWSEQYSHPLIAECARFYRSIANKEADSLWHLFVEPGMGQDERGGFNQKDYLCALYGAKYCFQKAIECGLDETGEYARILEDGLAFAPLKSENGFYYSCAGSGYEDFGQQKHPVQLNELAYLPTEKHPSPEALSAYKLRYDITRDATKPYFYGWTLGEFLLAGSRVGDYRGWMQDWNAMSISEYVDKDFIQVYETSQSFHISFYNTTNGLIAQSLCNNLICDWYGILEVGKCFPWKGKVEFRNIVSQLGVRVSGYIDGTRRQSHLELETWKDTEFKLGSEFISLKKGKRISRTITL